MNNGAMIQLATRSRMAGPMVASHTHRAIATMAHTEPTICAGPMPERGLGELAEGGRHQRHQDDDGDHHDQEHQQPDGLCSA